MCIRDSRYGIPEFKMEKHILDRRLAQMEKEGTRFRAGVDVGSELTGADLARNTMQLFLQWVQLNGVTCHFRVVILRVFTKQWSFYLGVISRRWVR